MSKESRTATQIAVAMSAKRERIAELRSGPAEGTSEEDHRAELDSVVSDLASLEPEYRAALALEATETETREFPTETPEQREFRELRGKVRIGRYVSAAMVGKAIDGAEGEFNQAMDMPENEFPLELLAPEARATTDAESGVMQGRWVDRLFSETAAMRLGVTFDTVSPGVRSYPVVTAGAASAQRGRSEAAADAGWMVGTTDIKPTRNAVRAVFSNEDAYRLPGLEDALRRDLAMALAEGVDRVIFTGDAGADEDRADIKGFTTRTGVTEVTLTQAKSKKGPDTLAAFAGLIDGKHAASPADLNVVAAVGANTLWLSTLANARDMTIAQFLRANGVNFSVRGDIETATTNGKFGAFIGLSRGIAGAAVAAVWASAQLVRDPYGGAAQGEVALTLSHYWGLELPRASNFARLKFVT